MIRPKRLLQNALLLCISIGINTQLALADKGYDVMLGYNSDNGEQWIEKTFHLPAECQAMKRFGDAHFGSFDMTRIRHYSSAITYCHNAKLLSAGAIGADNDFVTDYDFSSLPLTMISGDVHCKGGSSNNWDQFCKQVEKKSQKVCHPNPCSYPLSYAEFILRESNDIPWIWFIETNHTKFDKSSCRLQEFAFSGELIVNENTVYCKRSSDEERNKHISVTVLGFRDMNRDGYMDAVLKVRQTVNGSAPDSSTVFFLTRFNNNDRMQILDLQNSREITYSGAIL